MQVLPFPHSGQVSSVFSGLQSDTSYSVTAQVKKDDMNIAWGEKTSFATDKQGKLIHNSYVKSLLVEQSYHLYYTPVDDNSEQLSVGPAVGLAVSLTFILAFVVGMFFGILLCYSLSIRRRKHGDSTSAQEVTERPIINEIVNDAVSVKTSDPGTSGNIAYGVHQRVPTTSNPVYELVQR